MRAANESQKLLIELSSIDQKITRLSNQKQNHPQLRKIAELTARLPSIEASIVENDSRINETKKELARAEVDVENIAKRVEKDNERLNSGETSAKDLTQIQHEIGTLKSKQKDLEEVEISILEILEDLDHKKSGLQEILIQVNDEINQLNILIKDDFSKANSDIAVFTTNRNKVVAKIDKSLVELYDKIRLEHGMGAGMFNHGMCSSCQIQISPAEIVKINALDPEEVIRCENCRCILVRN
jgi:predicted  nucleic acid-binding Zn-ribbon protein